MATTHYFFHFLLLSSILFLLDCSKRVEAILHYQTHDFTINTLTSKEVCFSPNKGFEGLSKLEVAHKYGPCSPLERGTTATPTLSQTLLEDQTRVKSINSKISSQNSVSDSTAKVPANSGESLGTGNFVVRVGFGTPEQNFTIIFDTGSDFTWIQCLPCSGECYEQQDPYFNPSASSTYSNISCRSPKCSQLLSATGNKLSCTSNCIYKVSYGDGSYSQGDFATDTLTLSSSDVFSDFEFGCSHHSDGSFGYADGLLGLGRNRISTVSQTVKKYKGIFSYCLPSTTSSTGYLAFGEQSVASSGVQYTPLLLDPRGPSFYFLDLEGISVGGEKLDIPPSIFTVSGTIIDSGTVITRLPPKAYSALRTAFRQAMAKYPPAPSYSILDTCYYLNGVTNVTVPTVLLHFGGHTDLNVDESGILVEASSNQYCLAFAGNSDATDLAIVGNMQQQTIEVVYDVRRGKLGFGPKSCN